MRIVLALAIVACSVAAFAGPGAKDAFACSCGLLVPTRDLAKFDAAFVGTVSSKRLEGSNAFWTLDVEQAVKGALRTPLVVRTASSGSACGLELRSGERTGLLLYYDRYERARYESGLCYQTSSEGLGRVALPSARVIGDSGGSGGRWWPIAVGAGVLAALVFAGLALRRRA